MITREEARILEAWAWAEHENPQPHFWVFDKQGQTLEYMIWQHLAVEYPHIKPRWYARALWAINGEDFEEAVKQSAKIKARKNPSEKRRTDPLLVKDAVRYMPPWDEYHLLTRLVDELAQWRFDAAKEMRDGGALLQLSDIVNMFHWPGWKYDPDVPEPRMTIRNLREVLDT